MERDMYFIVLTNNPAVLAKYPSLNLAKIEGDVLAVFKRARDLVHKGHRLLTHPLSSSLKPGRIPYKTVVLTAEPQPAVDLESLNYMTAAMDAWHKTKPQTQLRLSPNVQADYAVVDLSIFESALDSLLVSSSV